MEITDLYVLVKNNDNYIVQNFISNYLNNFEPEEDYYEYPKYFGETEYETSSFQDMLTYVLNHSREYRFYFKSVDKESKILKGMIFINNNNTMYLGIGVMPDFEGFYKKKLENDFNLKIRVYYGGALPSVIED